MLKKLSNKKTLNLMILISCSIFTYSIYKVKEIKDINSSIDYSSDELSLSKTELLKASDELDELSDKFSKIKESRISPLRNNGHIILDDIKRDGRKYGLGVSFFLESSQGQNRVDFSEESGIDENTGVSFYQIRVVSTYDRYSELKKFIDLVVAKYPVAIKSLTLSGRELQFVINMYGD